MQSKARTKLYKQIIPIGGFIVLLVVSYYMNMPVDAKSIFAYLKAKPFSNL
jgi:hypothetical protein